MIEMEWIPQTDDFIDSMEGISDPFKPHIFIKLYGNPSEEYKNKNFSICEIIGILNLNGYEINSEFYSERETYMNRGALCVALRFNINEDQMTKIQKTVLDKKDTTEEILIKLNIKCFIIPEKYDYREIGFKNFKVKRMPNNISLAKWYNISKSMGYTTQ